MSSHKTPGIFYYFMAMLTIILAYMEEHHVHALETGRCPENAENTGGQ